MAKDLIIVMRDKPELYESLRREYTGRPDIEVLLDRRVGDAARPDDRRSGQELPTLRANGFARVAAGPPPAAEPPLQVERTGPPTPQQVVGRTFTWTVALNCYPPKVWRDLFNDTKDRSIDCSPDKVRFYQAVLIFDSDEDKVPIWMQFINGWIRAANARYLTHLEAERRARDAQAALNRDPRERIREAAARFKHL